jgi:peptide/nickel transport system substrate-binding protein
MNKGVKRLAVGALTVAVGASLVLAGCGSKTAQPPQPGGKQPAQETPVVGGTMIYTTIGDAKILIPSLTADTASSFITGLVYDSLLTMDVNLNFNPGLASSWDIKDDKIYTFNLRNDVKWHDGQPLTARDVIATFHAILHPKYTGVRAGDYSGMKGVRELLATYSATRKELSEKKIDDATADARMIEAYEAWKKTDALRAEGDHKIVVELSEPFAPFLQRFSLMGITPAHLLEGKMGTALRDSAEAKKPVGTGQFRFVEWVKDSHIVLQRNPDWKWGVKQKTNNIERMIVKVIPDSQANMVALETGETDYAAIQPDNFEHFKSKVNHVQTVEYMSFVYTYVGYNLKNPMFADKKVRQAITHAINRQEIVDTILLGHGTLAHSHGSPARWDFNPDVPKFEFNIAKADQLLDEAGWVKGADGIRAKDGKKFSFKLVTNNGNKIREQSAVIIQQALKKVGIDVKVELMEWNAFLDWVDGNEKEAYILGWSLGSEPDSHVIWHSTGGFNAMHGYQNADVDRLVEEGRKNTDLAKRKEIYGQLQRILAEDQPYTYLFFPNTLVGVNKRLKGLPSEVGAVGPMWNFEDWWIGEAKSAR